MTGRFAGDDAVMTRVFAGDDDGMTRRMTMALSGVCRASLRRNPPGL
jgi:hypothetical protein